MISYARQNPEQQSDVTPAPVDDHIAPAPRVSVQAFCETVETAAAVQSAGEDRRLGKAHLTVQMGGMATAIEAYRTVPTPNVIILETEGHSDILAGLDQLATVCDAGTRVVVIGRVNDPETFRPVAGAEVSIAWTEIEVSKEAGIRKTPHVLRDTTNAAGEFHICRLPNSMNATLQARKATTVTSAIPFSLAEEGPQLFARTLLLSRADSGTTAGNATVSGSVVLEDTPATAGSRVELVGTDVVAMTNDKGEFTMTRLPSGSHILLARHLGYGASSVAVDLTPREPQRVTIKLPKFVAIMDPVLVTARLSAGLDRVGFNERKKTYGSGYFFGPEQLQIMHPTYLTDILRQLPSIRVTTIGMNTRVTSRRGVTGLSDRSCVQYFVDDMPWQSAGDNDINDFVSGNEVVAVELYQPGQAPALYSRGMGACITVVLWTRFRMPDLTEK